MNETKERPTEAYDNELRRTAKPMLHQIKNAAATLSPKVVHDEEYGQVTKTDARTFKKIMDFAKDLKGFDSPVVDKRELAVSKEVMYNTLTDVRPCAKTSASFYPNKGLSKFEKVMIQKLGYEWKKIYR